MSKFTEPDKSESSECMASTDTAGVPPESVLPPPPPPEAESAPEPSTSYLSNNSDSLAESSAPPAVCTSASASTLTQTPGAFARDDMSVADDDDTVASFAGLGLGCSICPRPFNTTSTVIAASTVTNPDMEQIFFTLGCVLQAQIVEDEKLSDDVKRLHTTFDIIPDIKADYGGVCDLPYSEEQLDIDALNDPALRMNLALGRVPLVDTIVRFMKLLHQCAKYSVECNIVALVYLNRMGNLKHLALTMTNWRAVWLSCIMVAQKMWDDKPLKTSAFAQLVPPITKANLKDFEIKVLQLLDYTVSVKPSLYVKYYFELRDLFVSIIGFKDSDWQVKPLSIRNAKRMEALAERSLRVPSSTASALNTPASTPRLGASADGMDTPSTPAMIDRKPSGTLEDTTSLGSASRFVLS